MMTPTRLMSGQVPYLVDHAQLDDYLSEHQQVPGKWLGEAAKRLGLSGAVEPAQLTNLLKGLSPDGSTQLVQLNAIRKDLKHAAGIMLTFSLPKSVSLIAAFGNGGVSESVDAATEAAIHKTFAHIEQTYAFTRRGSGGHRIERCHLLGASHLHYTNRNGDPQWHAHVSVANVAVRLDGTTGTLQTQPFYDHQLAIGRFFRTSLAMELGQRLGLKFEADADSIRVAGFPKAVEEAFSTRRNEILTSLALSGQRGAAAAEEANLATRKPKQTASWGVLTADWHSRGAALGFGEQQVREFIHVQAPRQSPEIKPVVLPKSDPREEPVGRLDPTLPSQGTRKDRPALSVVGKQTEKEDTAPKELPPGERLFREYVRSLPPSKSLGKKDLPAASPIAESPTPEPQPTANAGLSKNEEAALKRLIVAAVQQGHPKDDIYHLIDDLLDKDTPSKGQRSQYQRELGTPEERNTRLTHIMGLAAHAAQDSRHYLAPGYVSRQYSKRVGQTEALRDAAVEVMSRRGACAAIETGPGFERDMFLRTLNAIYSHAGYAVRAVATTGTGAAALEKATEITTHSTTQFLYHVAPTARQLVGHHASQLLEAVLGHSTRPFDRMSLDAKTILLVTDAQNLDSLQVEAIQKAANGYRAKVIYLGDPAQYQSREPQNPFELLREKFGGIKLPESPRPVEAWAQDSIAQLTRGDVTGALGQYAMANRLVLGDDYAHAGARLIRQWAFLPQNQRGGDTLIITRNNDEARVLNHAAQYARREQGELGWFLKQRIDGEWVYRHDRVRMTANSKSLGYRHGDTGVIDHIGLDTISVRLDRTQKLLGFQKSIVVTIPRERYADVTLGYALDAFRAQSVGAARAFVLTDANERDAVTLRAQVSRATEETRVFTARHLVAEEVEQIHDLTRYEELQAAAQKSSIVQHRHSAPLRFLEKRFQLSPLGGAGGNTNDIHQGVEPGSRNEQGVEMRERVANDDQQRRAEQSMGQGIKP